MNILTILAKKQKVLANEMTQQMNPKVHTEALGADANLISCQESDRRGISGRSGGGSDPAAAVSS